MATYGVDSVVGRTAAIMLGSTETTFYAISVYFGAAGVRRTRYAIPAALVADCTGFFGRLDGAGVLLVCTFSFSSDIIRAESCAGNAGNIRS